ncbi:MAG: alpha-2-macroglobulin family protein, partial [Myxococcota bacterium]
MQIHHPIPHAALAVLLMCAHGCGTNHSTYAEAAPESTLSSPSEAQSQKRTDPEARPIFKETQPAQHTAPGLNLVLSPGAAFGWVVGTRPPLGSTVKVMVSGHAETVKLRKDGTFTWSHAHDKPVEAVFTLGLLSAKPTLEPRQTMEPTVFFVVDRSVYRPGQPVQFAGFLREMDAAGQFQPLSGKTVEVQLTSVNKKLEAARLKLTSDSAGRIEGTYTFDTSDALDDYTLTIQGHQGSARVRLAEFRKSKIKLEVSGEHSTGQALDLQFKAVDFLGQAVEGETIRFKAQVIRGRDAAPPTGLDPEEFVYHKDTPSMLPHEEHLSSDARLLIEAGVFPMQIAHGKQVVSQVEHTIAMEGQTVVKHQLPLEASWTRGEHRVVIDAVLVDQNGREQRTVQSIPLDGSGVHALEASLDRDALLPGEPVEIRAQMSNAQGLLPDASVTLVVMKLSNALNPVHPVAVGVPLNHHLPIQNHIRWQGGINAGYVGSRWPIWTPQSNSFQREMVNALTLNKGQAQLTLDEPGAYKLVIVARHQNHTLQKELGLVVVDPETKPDLLLEPHRATFSAGEPITGMLHSRIDGGRVLLLARDAQGVKAWTWLTTQGPMTPFRLKPTTPLSQGVLLSAHYVDAHGLRTHHSFIRVRPDDRLLDIRLDHSNAYGPGEMVDLDIEVNRQEEVDLVVSVYDASLLGVAPDTSVDVRNFYLADERIHVRRGQALLRDRLGHMTLGDLAKQAQALLKRSPDIADTPRGTWLKNLSRLDNLTHSTYLDCHALYHILLLVDQPTYIGYCRWQTMLDPKKETNIANVRLVDLLNREQERWGGLTLRVYGDTLMLLTPSQYRNGWNAWDSGLVVNNAAAFNARGDAHRSMASGNAFRSAPLSGQAFLSHMPAQTAPIAQEMGSITVRRDFSDLAYWSSRLRTDATGRVRASFKLPDSLTNWRVVVTAVSRDMHVGQNASAFKTLKPIMVWPMIPRMFTEGDTVQLYASVHNQTDTHQRIAVTLASKDGEIAGENPVHIELAPGANAPVYWRFTPTSSAFAELLMTAKAEVGSDASLKRLPVVRPGAEQIITAAGFARDTLTFTVPEDVDMESAQVELRFAPSLISDMVDTLDYLVQYPYGCVEQTMSRFTPAIAVSQTLEAVGIPHPGLTKKLPNVVQAGIKRLLQLQRPDGGWGWYGNGATHEMMTPYALYGLLKAEKAGYRIPDQKAIDRGLDRLEQFINAIHDKQATDKMYNMYVYAHRRPLSKAHWTFIQRALDNNTLSDYALALALETATTHRPKLAKTIAQHLRDRAITRDLSWGVPVVDAEGNPR